MGKPANIQSPVIARHILEPCQYGDCEGRLKSLHLQPISSYIAQDPPNKYRKASYLVIFYPNPFNHTCADADALSGGSRADPWAKGKRQDP